MRVTAQAEVLSAQDMAALDRDGFRVFPGLLDAGRLATLRRAFESAMEAAGQSFSSGTRHAALAGPAFDEAIAEPRLAAAARHILGRPFRVFQLSGRDPLPGFGRQGLHADWLPRSTADPYGVVTALWLLDPFMATNGSTRVVPGTHLLAGPVPRSFAVPSAIHPGEVLIQAPAGSALVFNGHLWHGGTRNGSRSGRRVIQCQFSGDEIPPPGRSVTNLPARGAIDPQALGMKA